MDSRQFDPKDYPIGATVYVEDGQWDRYTIAEYLVAKITPSGQVIAVRSFPNGSQQEIRLTPSGKIIGDGTWNRRHVVSAERAAESRREMEISRAWNAAKKKAEEIGTAAARHDAEALSAAMTEMAALASAIEARRVETERLDAKHESAVRDSADAQPLVPRNPS